MANLLTTTEAAKALGMNVGSLAKAARAGRIAVEHKGAGRTSARLFTPEAVAAFKRSRERAA